MTNIIKTTKNTINRFRDNPGFVLGYAKTVSRFNSDSTIDFNSFVVEIGEKGLGNTWQANFEPNTECVHCGKNARIAFVAAEEGGTNNKEYVANLHHNTISEDDGKFWVHDVMAAAIYLCEVCAKATVIYNQG